MNAFFEAVMNFGGGSIHCDMEDYGREPGDVVTVQLSGSQAVTMTGWLGADLIRAASEHLRQQEGRLPT